MDTLDAITLLYLSRNWDGKGTLLECAHTFQQTKAELEAQLNAERQKSIDKELDEGFTF